MTASRPLHYLEQEDIEAVFVSRSLDDTGESVAADFNHRRVRIRLSSGRGHFGAVAAAQEQ